MDADRIPVIDLSKAPGSRQAWDRPRREIYAWALCEILVLRNPLLFSSRLRVMLLRRFGARIGRGVIIRPGVRIKFPWKLSVGDRCWIGEDVWIHNQDRVTIAEDVVVSQGTFITTGSHAARHDMALQTNPVVIDRGAWVTSRCVILPGAEIGRSAVILPNTVVRGPVPANAIFGMSAGTVVGQRFPDSTPSHTHPR